MQFSVQHSETSGVSPGPQTLEKGVEWEVKGAMHILGLHNAILYLCIYLLMLKVKFYHATAFAIF